MAVGGNCISIYVAVYTNMASDMEEAYMCRTPIFNPTYLSTYFRDEQPLKSPRTRPELVGLLAIAV